MNASRDRRPTGNTLLPIGKVVAQLRNSHPSISQSSLRFLEREGLVEPTRTPGGHRLYSPADIERIQQIKDWQDQRLTLVQIRERLAQRDELARPQEISNEFLELVLNGHHGQARNLILETDALGMPLAQMFGEVLQPALFEIGERWEHGHVLVAQEKEISELVRDLIAELSQRHDRWTIRGPDLIAACVQGERHELGLRMISGLLRENGCRVYYLGADVAQAFLAQATQLHSPDLVILSIKLTQNLEILESAVEGVRDAVTPESPPFILVGGEAVKHHPGRVRETGAIAITDDSLQGVIQTVMSHAPSSGEEGQV